MLELREISKSFGGLKALRNCSFKVAEGSITGLIGPNGAGKTTAFNMVSTVIQPDAGSVTLNGRDIIGLQPHQVARLGIGRTFQITRELGDLSVFENMMVPVARDAIPRLLFRRANRSQRDRAFELLSFFGLAGKANDSARSLSYGQRKLLEFASVLMAEPRLVLLDEPAGGVNPRLLDHLTERIRLLNQEGLTFLIVEHNMDVVMRLSDSIVVMAHGEVLLTGTPAHVRADERVLDAYLGRA